jgi:hypothetical protein
LLGDLNAKHQSWNSRLNSVRGRRLRGLADEEGLAILGPTTATHELGDVLDIAIARNVRESLSIHTCVELSSDHNPTILLLGSTAAVVPPTERRDLKNADWQTFRKRVASALPRDPPTPDSPNAVDQMAHQQRDSITAAMQETIPVIRTAPFALRVPLPAGVRKIVATATACAANGSGTGRRI